MSDCVVLVSVGSHPVSKRPRLAHGDATAIALAQRAGLYPRLLHAGPPDRAEVLKRGLGLGADRLDLLEIGEGDDPSVALRAALERSAPGLVLTGARAETGECSGMIPYLLGAALDRPVLGDCVGLEPGPVGLVARRRLTGGARQVVAVPEPALLIAHPAARAAPLGHSGPVDPARVAAEPATAPPDPRHATRAGPARAVPPPIAPVSTRLAASDRIEGAEAGAEAILDFLGNRVSRRGDGPDRSD